MTTKLNDLLLGFHQSLVAELQLGKLTNTHPVSKGDASENAWLKLLKKYLPKRYQVSTGFIVDSEGNQSEQIDVIIFDRQYSPFVFKMDTVDYIPAESVYAVFEVKPTLNKDYLIYASKKAASVRKLKRTSLPVPNIYGEAKAKIPAYIHSGLLCLDSTWNPPFGQPFERVLAEQTIDNRVNLTCVALEGVYEIDDNTQASLITNKAATHFFLRLVSVLQQKATAPMMDIMAYGKWLQH